MPTGLGVDLHPYYQRGVTSLPGVEYGWLKMADGAQEYSKTAGGTVYTADAHAALFRQLGIPFGGYVYAQPGDGAAEARVLWAECQRLGGTSVAPACDIESDPKIHVWSAEEATDHGRAYCSEMLKRGVRPAIYMNDALAGQTGVEDWPENPVLWIARYGAKPAKSRYDVHQYRSDGTLPGSAGLVDWNQAYTTAHLIDTEVSELDSTQAAQLSAIAQNSAYVAAVLARYPDSATNGDADANGTPIYDTAENTRRIVGQLKTLGAQVTALGAAVAALSKDNSLTADAVKQIINDAVAKSLGESEAGGSLTSAPKPARR